MTSEKRYSISYNSGIVDKSPNSKGAFARGWLPIEASEQDIVDTTLKGWAMAPQYEGGHRKAIYFNRAGFLAADVDGGMTLNEARDHHLVKHHAGLIHTTASHTADRHRYRIIFPLTEPVLSAEEWADAQLGLAMELGSDKSATDGARMFFGFRGAKFLRISRAMPPDVIADLIARGRAARAAGRPLDGRRLPLDSARRVAGAELIKLASGPTVRMDELGAGVSVHCPNHDDANASAFTVRSTRSASVGIHCMACHATFWLNGDHDDYDFDGFDRLFEERQLADSEPDPDAKGFDRYFPLYPKFEKLQDRFLPALAYEPGITLVKSPKGSGKTEALKRMIDQIRAGEFLPSIKSRDVPRSILLLGHRQTLLIEAARKLGLHCYLDGPERSTGPFRTLAVCLDSLPKFTESGGGATTGFKGPYDLVIIDESEQVLSHLIGETIKTRMGVERCFDALHWVISRAKAVVALDADLTLVTTHGLRTMRPQDWEGRRCRIVYNQPLLPERKRTMRLFASKMRLEKEVIEAVKLGQKCFIVSNSKRGVKILQRMIEKACGVDVIMRVVTADNSRDGATRGFLENIRTEFLRVQVVIASPSLGTGIDITFPGGACVVDRVFGFFYPFINTHTDIDQQLARVRNPGAIDVWISPYRFSFTSNVHVVMDDLARAYTVKRAVRGRPGADGMVDYNREDPLLMICAHVTAQQRASKNRLLPLFCRLREKNGWIVERFGEKAPESPYNEAKRELAAERVEALKKAPTISDGEFVELDDKKTKGAALSPAERIAHEKKHFEREVGLPLDDELVELNADGRLLDRLDLLSRIAEVWSKPYLGDLFLDACYPTADQPRSRLRNMPPASLIAVLMRAAGLTKASGFESGTVVSSATLAGFVKLCRDNRTVIEEATGVEIRDDLAAKPVKQLNLFLREVGQRLELLNVEKRGGKKFRYYRLDAVLAERMLVLARSMFQVRAKRETDRELERDRTRRTGGQEKTRLLTTDTALLSPQDPNLINILMGLPPSTD